MELAHWLSLSLAGGATIAALTVYPYTATAVSYRGSDNGLAYILFVMGVSLWNAMYAVQLLDTDVTIQGFFFSLSLVGGSLAGLGWFLFAATASSTRTVPRRQTVYGLAAIGVGANIVSVITNPTHEFYWTIDSTGSLSTVFVHIDPTLFYWAHTLLLVVLFGAGTALFFEAWRADITPAYSRAYTVVGTATVIALVTASTVFHSELPIAPIAAAVLATIGWLQAGGTTSLPFR